MLCAGCSFDIDIGTDQVKGTGDIRTESYEFDDSFEAVRIEDTFDAVIEVGPAASVVVQAHDNFFDHIVVESTGGELVVQAADGTSLDGVTNVTITMASLDSLDVSGASSAQVLGTVNGERLDVEVSGSSEVSFEKVNAKNLATSISGASEVKLGTIAVEKLRVDASGASNVTATGQTVEASLDISGASDIRFGSLALEDANISIAGASDIDLRKAANVRGDLSGTSRLRVAPSTGTDVDVSGLSEMTHGSG